MKRILASGTPRRAQPPDLKSAVSAFLIAVEATGDCTQWFPAIAQLMTAVDEAAASSPSLPVQHEWRELETLKAEFEALRGSLLALEHKLRIYADSALDEAMEDREMGAMRAEAHQQGLAEAFKGAARSIAQLLADTEPKL